MNYPETPAEWAKFRREAISQPKRIRSNEDLRRGHPRIQLFLAARTFPDRWKFWFEKGFIWGQQKFGRRWEGPIVKLKWDGVDEYLSHDYDITVHGGYL